MKEAKETWWPLFPGKIKEETKAEETRKIRERESSSRVSKSFSPFLPQVTLLSQFHQDKRERNIRDIPRSKETISIFSAKRVQRSIFPNWAILIPVHLDEY